MVLPVHWSWSRFEELSLQEWHDIVQLRVNVFVVEQHCPYPELEGKDPECIHIKGQINDSVIATARIVPPGISYQEVSIGRVAVAQNFRGKGFGRILMNTCLQAIDELYGKVPVRLSAQTYLLEFYEQCGFTSTGNEYLEDGIPHTEMLRTVLDQL